LSKEPFVEFVPALRFHTARAVAAGAARRRDATVIALEADADDQGPDQGIYFFFLKCGDWHYFILESIFSYKLVLVFFLKQKRLMS
jgi:hypothetical protein